MFKVLVNIAHILYVYVHTKFNKISTSINTVYVTAASNEELKVKSIAIYFLSRIIF